jgi:hypothetical protein
MIESVMERETRLAQTAIARLAAARARPSVVVVRTPLRGVRHLSAMTRNALLRAGYEDLETVLAEPDDRLRGILSFGEKSLAEVRGRRIPSRPAATWMDEHHRRQHR